MTAKLLLALASIVIPGSDAHGTHDHTLLFDGPGSFHTSGVFNQPARSKLLYTNSKLFLRLEKN
jgi:hypothetical protein